MANFAAKFSSATIEPDQVRSFIAGLPALLEESYSDRALTFYYGFDCNIHNDLTYKPMRVALKVFSYFVEDSIDRKIYEVGKTDMSIESPDSDWKILLCHESDIHLEGENDEFIQKIIKAFPVFDFRSSDDWKAHYKVEAETGRSSESEE